ncbi:MAG: hypothetical protein GW855_08450 [Erythrobacter sp.]|nr:hypothetical protein [Erythrobacter sp.]NCQ64931.1 hypothetical protein [Alphaproteobacteria bacterium]
MSTGLIDRLARLIRSPSPSAHAAARNTVDLAPVGAQSRRFVALISIKNWPSQTMLA